MTKLLSDYLENFQGAQALNDGSGRGITKSGEIVPIEAMNEIYVLKRYIQSFLVEPALRLNWACPIGQTFEEMRANLYKTPLYGMGDARLIWVNEGDFGLLTLHVDMLESKANTDNE